MEPVTGEKGGPADASRDMAAKIEGDYRELLKKEQEAQQAREQGETAVKFDNVRKLGFATKTDIDDTVKGIFGKFASENEAMRKEITALREFVLQAKARGLNSGVLDQPTGKEASLLDKFKPAFRENWKG